MEALWLAMNGLDRIFLLCAVTGGMLFVVRVFIGLFAGDGDADGDVDGDVHVHDAGDADISFKLLTVQGLTAFFMMFGLAGLAFHRGSGFDDFPSVLGAFVAGTLTMLIIAKLTQMMLGLQSTGNIDNRRAIGQTGTIYLTIPAGGTGSVQVTIQDRMRTMDAVAQDKKQIKTGERIEVVDLIGGNTLVVKKL